MKLVKPVYETVGSDITPRVYSLGKAKICEVSVTVKRRNKSQGAQVSKNLDTLYNIRKEKFDNIESKFRELCNKYNKSRM